MAIFDLSSSHFWHSDDSHVLVNPQRPCDADGIVDFVERTQGKNGWCLVQTSGTEGLSKWVALTKAGMLISAATMNRHLEATAQDRWLVALPTHHVGGFSISARAMLAGNEVTPLPGKWEASRFAATCRIQGITLTSLVPAQVVDLVREKLVAPDCLRAIVVGGAGLSREMGAAASELGWPVLQSFGMTEACSQIATEPLDHLHSGFDPDCLEVLPQWQLTTDAEEHLILRGPALAAGYVTRTPDDQWQWQAIDDRQGLRTRDRVSLWDHGTRRFLRFLGREAQVLKILGELVNLAPLQAKLDALAQASAKAVIVPVPDERRGTALVLASAGDDGAALMTAFNAGVQPFERLQRLVNVDRIPVTDLGKVKLGELIDRVMSETS